MAELRPRAQRFLAATVNGYALTATEGLLLLEAVRALSRCEAFEHEGSHVLALRERRFFYDMVRALNLPPGA